MISNQTFDYIRSLLEQHSGIALEPGKEYLVEGRLKAIVAREKLDSFEALCNELRRNAHRLVTEVVDALTTNETSFFRDPSTFEALKLDVLPRLIEERKSVRKLTIWCGASSSGQEPLTLAILLRENFPELAAWDVSVVATDISPTMVERCRSGLYSEFELTRGLTPELRRSYFEEVDGRWRARPELTQLVDYRLHNLLHPWPAPAVDIVMLRNVMIYFSGDTKGRVLDNVARALQSDGYLFLGASEALEHPAFRREQAQQAFVHRKRA